MKNNNKSNEFTALRYSRTPLGIASDPDGSLLNLDQLPVGVKLKVLEALKGQEKKGSKFPGFDEQVTIEITATRGTLAMMRFLLVRAVSWIGASKMLSKMSKEYGSSVENRTHTNLGDVCRQIEVGARLLESDMPHRFTYDIEEMFPHFADQINSILTVNSDALRQDLNK